MSGIFGELHEDAFLLFSRQNKRLYAQAVLEIWREFFGTFHPRIAPRRAELCDFIAGLLVKNPELWTDPEELEDLPDTAARRGRKRRKKRVDTSERDPVALKADHVYRRLVDCGWIEEDQIDFVIIAEMPTAAQAMAERFHEIDQGLAQILGGVVITIRNALNSLQALPEENSLGLKQAVDSAIAFIRRLRAIHSSLRAIKREISGSTDLKMKLRTFFEEFLGRLLVQDFKLVLTTNHPYRFRNEIMQLAEDLLHRNDIIHDAAAGYVSAQLAATQESAETLVRQHLDQIRDAFDAIADSFQKINDFRIQLEGRLRNTIRYMERADEKSARRLAAIIQTIAKTETARAKAGLKPLEYRSQLMIQAPRLSAAEGEERRGSLALPAPRRHHHEEEFLAERVKNPALAELRRLERDWLAMTDPDISVVLKWLDRKIRPGESLDAGMIRVGDLEQLFLFLKMRSTISAGHREYEIERLDGRRDDPWLETSNFRITRAEKAS
jgi:hypothetical protein